MNSRYKNYGLWVSLAALLGMILLDTNLIVDLGRYQQYVDIVLVILIGAGIINNPTTTAKGYLDDKKGK